MRGWRAVGAYVIFWGRKSKSQPSKNGVDEFIRKKLRRLGVFPEVFPVLVTCMVTEPEVEDYVRQKGIALYYSYDF